MKTLNLHTNLTTPTKTFPSSFPIRPKPFIINYQTNLNVTSFSTQPTRNTARITKQARPEKCTPKLKSLSEHELLALTPKGHSRMMILGAMSIGLVLFLMGFDDHKALALGPEGPLMEEFWDNMRRYALYALTVSTGAIYTLLEPILELLKNPLSAILILTIIAGSVFIVSQVVTAMVGLSDFSYEYNY